MSTCRLAGLVAWYQDLSPSTLDRIAEFYTADAWFKDPFQELTSRARLRQVYAHMFARLEAPRFEITGTVQQDTQAFLLWTLHVGHGRNAWAMRGSTHLVFAPDGRVQRHRDYWDPAEELYEKLPVLGWLMRQMKKKLRAPTAPGEAED